MDIYAFLDQHQIAYTRHDHPPVFTVADVKNLAADLPAPRSKNLFLRDKKGTRHFLIVMAGEKRLDMKALPALLNCTKVSFGSAPRLARFLQVEPGAVTVLAVINDPARAVEVVFDRALWESKVFQFHPLVNTSTLIIDKQGIERFLAAADHPPTVIDLP